ncbi:MAG: hypothetical protein AB7L13_18260 [Acidimicrobiia bacterium]
MGKASSAKKVARAAKAGGRVRVSTQRNLLFPSVMAAVIILGTFLVVYGRSQRTDSAKADPPIANVDHWHTAYGVYICDKFLEPLNDQNDELGIHTHGDGVIHVHPFYSSSSGTNARLKLFFDTTKTKISDDKLDLGSLGSWEEGKDKCGDQDAELQVKVWRSPGDEKPETFLRNFGSIRFLNDREVMTIAFVPKDTDVPQRSESVAQLDQLTDVDSGVTGGATTTAGAAGATTTVAGATTSAGAATTAAPTTAAAASTSGS